MNVILLAALLAAGPDQIVAQVDGRPILAVDVHDQLRGTRGAAPSSTPQEALQLLVSESLLAEEAERQGLEKDPAIREAIEAEKQRIASDRFLDKEVDGAVHVNESTVRAVFHSRADVARIAAIIVASEAEARAILDRLGKGAQFAQEARASLDAKVVAKGGDMGDVSRGDMDPAMAELAFSAPIGKAVGPCRLQLGVAVVKVAARSIGSEKEYQARRAGLEQYVRQQTVAELRRHYTQALRGQAGVKLDEAFLQSTGARLTATAEERQHALATIAGHPVRYADILPDMMTLSRGREGGHLSGPRVKTQIAWAFIDRKLIEDAMKRSGYAARPEVAMRGAAARRMVLARALIEKFRSSGQPGSGDGALLKVLGDLHARARIITDDAALQSASRLD
ncbi:MAG TPA: peptidylprolyl isomerase [Anaeromyxobacteraceae bacterium]|jgi:peptidyl-prolyl cis-trans isomerase C|nr:peptidylprolyl isomerase [Anaeromyxobacteraceae bacterium]